jgi:hypothetical protein
MWVTKQQEFEQYRYYGFVVKKIIDFDVQLRPRNFVSYFTVNSKKS